MLDSREANDLVRMVRFNSTLSLVPRLVLAACCLRCAAVGSGNEIYRTFINLVIHVSLLWNPRRKLPPLGACGLVGLGDSSVAF